MENNKDLFPLMLENSFRSTIEMCLDSKEFMNEYRRLTGSHIGEIRKPIESLIDEATGRDDKAYRDFFGFVSEFVWKPWLFEGIRN